MLREISHPQEDEYLILSLIVESELEVWMI